MTLESIGDSDDDMDSPERGLGTTSFTVDDIHPLSRLRNESLRENRRGSGTESRKKNGKAKMMAMNKVRLAVWVYGVCILSLRWVLGGGINDFFDGRGLVHVYTL